MFTLDIIAYVFGLCYNLNVLSFMTVLGTFPTVLEPMVQKPTVGQHLVLECNPPANYPAGIVYWSEVTATSKPKPIDSTERLSLDYAGEEFPQNLFADWLDCSACNAGSVGSSFL